MARRRDEAEAEWCRVGLPASRDAMGMWPLAARRALSCARTDDVAVERGRGASQDDTAVRLSERGEQVNVNCGIEDAGGGDGGVAVRAGLPASSPEVDEDDDEGDGRAGYRPLEAAEGNAIVDWWDCSTVDCGCACSCWPTSPPRTPRAILIPGKTLLRGRGATLRPIGEDDEGEAS